MIKIPLQKTPAQTFKIKLSGQNCEMRVYYRFGNTYLDLICNGQEIQKGAICRNRDYIITIAQSAFSGNLFFLDMLGENDPLYNGFGERWRFFYMTEEETANRKPVEIADDNIILFLPFQDGVLRYNKSAQSPTWKNYDTTKITISGDLSEINAGVYQASATPIGGYKWYDGTISAKPVSWEIEKATVTIPTVSSSYTYDGDEQTVSIDDYDPDLMTVTGTDSATDAGLYTLTFSLIDTQNYKWEDGTIENKVVSWVIQKKNILIPTVVNTTKTYNGTAQAPTILSYDTDAITVSGNQSATDAGTYALFFSLTSTNNYSWSDGTTGLKVSQWYINPKPVEIPTVTDTTKTYNGAVQSPTISPYDANIISASGDMSATVAGNYAVMFSLIDSANYCWSDSTTAAKVFDWTIEKATVFVPVLSDTTKTYSGAVQSPTISAYDISIISATGDLSATDAGSYTITFSLIDADNYQWTDETSEPKTDTWSIEPKAVAIPTMTNKAKTYTGGAQSPTISAFSASEVTQTGTDSATNAGSYTVYWDLTSTTNYEWTDGTTSQKSDTWTIAAKSVTVPTLSNTSKTYNGSVQAPTISTYSADEITVGGATSATNAGTYTVTFTLTSTTNYKWSDNTTAPKSATWTIAKAAGSLSITPTSMSLGSYSLTGTIAVTRAGDGAISAVSSDTSIATASVSGTTVTVTAVATGNATITVSVAEGTNYLAPSNKTASVAVQLVFGFKNTGYQPFGQGIFIP